jgi:PTH1 family peptidyl-tRNA hydrolase
LCVWAVIGLGNPGKNYLGTRHNAGFSFVKKVAKDWEIKLRKRKFMSKAAVVERNQGKILLAMPQTYMNKSGIAVKKIIDSRKISPERLLVVYDDLDIPLGEIRIRKEGGSGSHKGLISVIQEIETTHFPRIRLGIGPLEPDVDAADFVLSPFEEDQAPLFKEGLSKAQKALEYIISEEIEKAMNLYNLRSRAVMN